ncbi:ABC transporter permease [Blastococcus sp. TF02A-30]|uniref:ABC transporter permease n=1 Tax=Blastococcus sp. TF02A-30 TaxID=2250580 RepID=UPI000DE981BA|nr:ABC transporter permease [Blastococcus sp. TF02A-30]RBY92976.1 ABC transporter permease [Blastococcus sp. TF02A-30]
MTSRPELQAEVLQPTGTGPEDTEAPATPSTFVRRFRRNKVGVAALALLVVVVLLAVFAPWIAPHDPNQGELSRALEGPSGEYWFGTDDLGRDVLSRLIHASRVSLVAAALATGVALLIGLPLGLISGYFGGWVDNVIMRFNDALMSFPALILAVVIVGLLGPSLTNAMLAIGIVYAPRIMRVVRGSALSVREEVYVLSARATGCGAPRIIGGHVLPNILSPLVVQTTIMLGLTILAEAGLSFLGLGVQPPTASWGSILGRAFPYMGRTPTTVIVAGLTISVVVLAFNLLGDAFRDSLGRERRDQ